MSIQRKNNLHRKQTNEDKFIRKYWCTHARLNYLRNQKRLNRRRLRRILKQEE